MSKRVSFLVAGVQKGGTTALFDYLNDHPDLALPAIKEAHFFDDEGAVDWTAPDYRPYHALFAGREQAQWGEATPIYTYWPNSLERIARYNPDMRLILIFRDPVARAWSHWKMEYARGAETRPFSWAIREGRARVADDPSAPGHHRVFSYVERGFYGAQVERLLSLFPRQQVLFLASHELRATPALILGRVCDFLNAAPLANINSRESHVARNIDYGQNITVSDIDYLKYIYSLDTEKFRNETGISFRNERLLS